MLADDPARQTQIAFEEKLAATGPFEPDKREPAWMEVKEKLRDVCAL
ncbi:hypothetical protein [Methylocystis parvus]